MGLFSRHIGSFRWFTALVYPVRLSSFSCVCPLGHELPQDASHGKAAKFALIKLFITWIIVLNAVGWRSIQMGLAWGFTKMPVDWFNPGRTLFWERSGRFYEVVFRIKNWRDRLTDAARWFGGGFAKRALAGEGRDYSPPPDRRKQRQSCCSGSGSPCRIE